MIAPFANLFGYVLNFSKNSDVANFYKTTTNNEKNNQDSK